MNGDRTTSYVPARPTKIIDGSTVPTFSIFVANTNRVFNSNGLGSCFTETSPNVLCINYPGTYEIRSICYTPQAGRMGLAKSLDNTTFNCIGGQYVAVAAVNKLFNTILTVTQPTYLSVFTFDAAWNTINDFSFTIVQIPTVAAITQQTYNLNTLANMTDVAFTTNPVGAQFLTFDGLAQKWKNTTVVDLYNTSYARLL